MSERDDDATAAPFPARARPANLRNLGCCFGDGELRAIERTPDHALDARAFEVLFTVSGCTATYDERLHFVPGAFDALRDRPDEREELVEALVYFISTQASALARDGFLAPARRAFERAFIAWTSSFTVVHFDLAACRAKGWRRDHSDYVVHGQLVRVMIDGLLRYATHADLAEGLVTRWGRSGRSPTDAAWLLEYARAERDSYAHHAKHEIPAPSGVGPDAAKYDMTPSLRSAPIQSVVMSHDVLRAALADVVTTIVPDTPSPTYWFDLVHALGLEGGARS